MRRPYRPRSPAPDGPGDHDHAVPFPVPFPDLRLRPEPRPGYFDDGIGRAGQDHPCPVDELCALVRDHGGGCDPRPPPERSRALRQLLDRGFEDDALTAAVEREAADALRRARS